MSEVIPINQIQIGNTINTLVGYTITVVGIEIKKINQWSTPYYELTVYNNIDDSKKEYKKKYAFNDYVTLVK